MKDEKKQKKEYTKNLRKEERNGEVKESIKMGKVDDRVKPVSKKKKKRKRKKKKKKSDFFF